MLIFRISLFKFDSKLPQNSQALKEGRECSSKILIDSYSEFFFIYWVNVTYMYTGRWIRLNVSFFCIKQMILLFFPDTKLVFWKGNPVVVENLEILLLKYAC